MNRGMKIGTAGSFVAFIGCLFLPHLLLAQDWQDAYPNYPTDDIMSLVRWNGDTLFSFGLNYSISRSDDAGKTWKRISHDDNGYNLIRAGATDRSIILLPSATQATLKVFTDTTGTSMFLLSFNPWTYDTTRVEVPLAFPGFDIDAYDISIRNECIAVLQIRSKVAVVLSTDRGKNWSVKPIPLDFGVSYSGSIEMYDSNRGALIGYNLASKSVQVWITDDGFKTIRSAPNVTYLRSQVNMFRKHPLSWVDDSTLVVVNNGTVPMITHDAGVSWKAMAKIGWEIGSISFSSSGIGYATCQNHAVYKTTDWGSTWVETLTSLNSMAHVPFTPLALALNDDEMIVTDLAGHIQRTDDGGITWDDNGVFNEVDYCELFFADKNNGTCIASDRTDGIYYLYATNNGGKTWLKSNSLPPAYAYYFYESYFVSNQTIFLYGAKTANSLLMRTVDGGINWDNVLDTTKCKARQIFPNYGHAGSVLHRGNSVYFYSDKGVLKSTDGGNNWSLHSDSSVVSYNEFMGFDASDTSALLLLSSQQLLKSTDDGYSWGQLFKIPSGLIYGQLIRTKRGVIFLLFTNAKHDSAYVYKSSNNGFSWDSHACPAGGSNVGSMQIFDNGKAFILAKNNLRGYPTKLLEYESEYFTHTAVLGSSGDEVRTVKNSLSRSTSQNYRWRSYYFYDDDNGWVGSTNSILRTSNGGVDWVETQTGSDSPFKLFPVYPNPLASELHVSYFVSGMDHHQTEIEVYDANGRRICIQNRGFDAYGNHSASFDISSFQSGIYFVRIKRGNVSKITKFIVSK